jgi:malonyl-CoA O-methyltransferase
MASNTQEPVGEPFFADRAALKRNFGRAAASFAHGDRLHREVASRMLERFDVIRLDPARIVDLGCGTGGASQGLLGRFPAARVVGVDLVVPMVRAAVPGVTGWRRWLGVGGGSVAAVNADMASLPFADGVFALAWSNLVLHWADDPFPTLTEARRVLETDGLFMFSALGPDTLRELRESFAVAGEDLHVKRFIDLHDIGDALGRAGFSAPVMDMEVLTLTYKSLDGLFSDLRATGSVNAMRGRRRTLTAPGRMRAAREAYEARRREGRLPATFEVIYGHAWKAAPRRTVRGESVVTFSPRRK